MKLKVLNLQRWYCLWKGYHFLYSEGRTQNRCLESPALSYSKSFILSACSGSYFATSNGYSVLHYSLVASIVDPRLTIKHSDMSFNFDSSHAATTEAT